MREEYRGGNNEGGVQRREQGGRSTEERTVREEYRGEEQ